MAYSNEPKISDHDDDSKSSKTSDKPAGVVWNTQSVNEPTHIATRTGPQYHI